MYSEKIKITNKTPNDNITDFIQNQIKSNEQDTYDSQEKKEAIEEELKKYTEPFSPYSLFLLAYKMKVSDIRFLPLPKDAHKKGNEHFTDDRTIIFFKISGFWEKIATIDRNKHILYINAIKNWAIKGAGNLTAENQRISQDGKGVLYILNDEKRIEKAIQLRIATAPQHIKDDEGNSLEVCVIRLLDNQGNPTLEEAGFNKFDYKKTMSVKDEKKGLILISGPTGSGKSSSLFGIIEKNNDLTKNMISFENPVEFDVPGVSQIEINPIEDISDNDETTQNFSRSKDFAMRAAPDILLVGEIRNYYTAETAMTFANTGHLTEATIHTNSSLETIDRLLGFTNTKTGEKLDKYLVLSVLKYVSAQMLVPSLCPHCKIKVSEIENEKNKVKSEGDEKGVDYYEDILKEISVQRNIAKRELLRNNIKVIPELKGINEKVIENWIDNSFVANVKGCSKCNERKGKDDKIRMNIGRKGRVLINETLLLDEYITSLLKEEPFNKERVKKDLLDIRPMIEKGKKGYYLDNDKYSFITLYQDALFKALLPEKVYNKLIVSEKTYRSITLQDALIYGY